MCCTYMRFLIVIIIVIIMHNLKLLQTINIIFMYNVYLLPYLF